MKKYSYTTTKKSLLGDLHTPVSLYMKLRDLYTQSALMESSDYHGEENSHSIVGFEPLASIAINHGKAQALYPDGSDLEDLTKCLRQENGKVAVSLDTSHLAKVSPFYHLKRINRLCVNGNGKTLGF